MGVGNSLNISQSGFVAFDGISVFTGRTLTAGTGISITNPNGIVGNPTISCTVTGTVTSVSGTANRITVTNPTTTPQIDISSSYVGQNSITTLGTISSGTWNGTVVEVAYGGTGANNTPTSGTLLRGNGTAFVPTTATYPSAAGSSGNVLTSDGTNWSSQAPAATGVTSVSGTANRITSTGGTTPQIDIAATYVGQASITTLGTVATGTWNATVIGLAYGGTNANLTASDGGIFYSTSTAGAILAGTATAGQILRSGSNAAPSWSIATYPSTAGTSGNVLTSDGTNWTSSTPTSGTITTLNWSLTNAQIKALHATPVELVAAPGSGKAIVVTKSVVKLTYGGTNAFTAGGGAQVEYYYGTSQTSGVAMGNASIIATANRWNFLNGKAEGTVTTTPENLALNLYNASATEIAGNAANNNLISGSLSYFIATI